LELKSTLETANKKVQKHEETLFKINKAIEELL
jgi:hypothetical protein